jgi:uncharacterized protein (DUF362 family)/NAD-dependent dihydropyrimidine dehydrogenase PreA subunit
VEPAILARDTVALVQCADYAHSRAAVESALTLLGAPDLLRRKRVLFKVNLMKGEDPALSVNTHPEFVAALAAIVRDAGGQAVIADSSGILGCTDEAFESSGIAAAVRREGGTLLNLDSCEMIRAKVDGRVLREAWLPKPLFEADLLATVPKLKTHTIMRLTCALKNQVGTLPGGQKCHLHEMAPSPERLAEAITDLNRALPTALAIVDGIVGLAGQGIRRAALPRKVGTVIVGANLAAVDVIAARLIGMDPADVPTCAAAAARGMVAPDWRVHTVGEPVQEMAMKFEPPGFEPKRIAPYARIFYGIRGRSVRPHCDINRCGTCGACARACPARAIVLSPYPEVGAECIRCYACHENCPHGAMNLKLNPLLRRSFAKRAGKVGIGKFV